MNPANAAELRAALERHGFRFSKSRGQNFLIDPNIPRRIAECSGADEGSFVLEVGPGAGSLTVAANPTRRALPGTVWLYHGYREADVNAIIPAGHNDPYSGFPGYRSVRCRVEKEAQER